MNALNGPAEAGNYRVKVGRFGDRWYTDPLPTCPIAEASDWQGPSVSTTKPPFANKYVTMKSVAEMSGDEWRRLAELEPDARYEAIKAHEKVASRVNMDRGTIVHSHAEDHLKGWAGSLAVIGSEEARRKAERFFPALDSFLNDYQPELVVAPEVVCLNRTLNGIGYGGTADAFVKIDGETWVVDWKSRNSDHDAYLEEGAQGGAYIGAEYLIAADESGMPQRVRIPDVAGVLIVSIREDGYRAFPIDAKEAVTVYRAMHAWWTAQRHYTDSGAKGRPWAPRVTPADSAPSPSAAPTKEQIVARFQAMTAHDQGKFKAERKARSIDNDDTAALWALADEVESFNDVHVPPVERPEPEPAPTRTPKPDEGDDIDDATYQAVKDSYDKLTSGAAEWLTELSIEGKRCHDWRLQQARTVRRFEIYRGLIALGAAKERLADSLAVEIDNHAVMNDVIVRPLVWAASGSDDSTLFANVTAGEAIGSLNATEAAAFAVLAAELADGKRRTVIDPDNPDRWQLVAA